ncbi:MAG: tail fiber domain-containing protein, partial [Phycisphaerales bacterium]|nr:tail fiber domain-containing protein [Phycisphaerales bacterium]
ANTANNVPWSGLTGLAGVPTGQPFYFGAVNENTDTVSFTRTNFAANQTVLTLELGNDPGVGGNDAFLITANNQTLFQFNTQSGGQAIKTGGGMWSSFSDERLKHDIKPMAGTLDRLLQLRGYSFEYNADAVASNMGLPGTQLGLIAQEVERVFPDWVQKNANGYRYVTERSTTALMVEALRDLRAEKDRQIDALKADAARRDAENAELKARLAAIEAALLKMNK